MKVWVVVPAAGTGSRFGTEMPKQYQLLAGKTVMARTLETLLSLQPTALIVALNSADQRWKELSQFSNPSVRTVIGGRARADSVRSGLESIASEAGPDDWVLVHDVARPCVLVADIKRLMETLSNSLVGGILATPVSDTLKRIAISSKEIQATEDRSQFWAAQTPQMFRYGLLAEALASADESATDEASAIEQLGYTPVVVEGSRDNLKITRREDMAIAEAIVKFQENRS